MTESEPKTFQSTLMDFYAAHGRHAMPWRLPEPDGSFDPYKIMVSELMLQQTQVARVIPKFAAFIAQFPDVAALAQAQLAEVLIAWSGLGYNRRAKYLHQAGQLVVHDYHGKFPRTIADLLKLPGVGKNTAGAIMAYAFNEPALFIETNVRTVYIHHFFHDQTDISDAAIQELLEATIDKHKPRIFYWALMDYGAYLKQRVGNLNKLSKTYTKQTAFQGSLRQIRGQVLRTLTMRPHSLAELVRLIPDKRLPTVLEALTAEGMIRQQHGTYRLT